MNFKHNGKGRISRNYRLREYRPEFYGDIEYT